MQQYIEQGMHKDIKVNLLYIISDLVAYKLRLNMVKKKNHTCLQYLHLMGTTQ